MSRFTDILLVSPLADGKTWVVMRDFGYDVGTEGSTDRIDVAVGFQTDFASVPRLFWTVLPKWGNTETPASSTIGSTGRRRDPERKPMRFFSRRWACSEYTMRFGVRCTGPCACSVVLRGTATSSTAGPALTVFALTLLSNR